jgi:hypothetical protein
MIMKKNKSLFIVAILALTMVITSCATTVTVSYMKPAKFNLSEYKNLAVATTEVKNSPVFGNTRIYIDYDNYNNSILTGYSRLIPSDIADYYTDEVYTALSSSGLFKLISPAQTDQYIKNISYGVTDSSKLYDMGADAIFTSEIEYLDYNEYPVYGDYMVVKNPNYVIGGTEPQYINSDLRKVTIYQEAQMRISYSIIDLQTGYVLASNSYTDSVKNSVSYDYSYMTSLTSKWMFKDIADDFISSTKDDLIPHTVYSTIELMDNKPKNSLAGAAMDMVESNQLAGAQALFEQAWDESSHLPSGYNAALLLEAMGQRTEAIYLMQEVYNTTGSADAMKAYSRMKSYETSSIAAKKQIGD